MRITIGSLIRKELSDPDSYMSRRVRKFRAYAYLCKRDPEQFRMEFSKFYCMCDYFVKRGEKWEDFHESTGYGTMESLLNLV